MGDCWFLYINSVDKQQPLLSLHFLFNYGCFSTEVIPRWGLCHKQMPLLFGQFSIPPLMSAISFPLISEGLFCHNKCYLYTGDKEVWWPVPSSPHFVQTCFGHHHSGKIVLKQIQEIANWISWKGMTRLLGHDEETLRRTAAGWETRWSKGSAWKWPLWKERLVSTTDLFIDLILISPFISVGDT